MFVLVNTHYLYSNEIKIETNIDSILKIKPELKYNENLKYQRVDEYIIKKDKEIKSNYDFGFNIDVNKEERTLEGIKIDIGTNF